MLDVAGDFARITFLYSRQFVCFVGKGKSLFSFSKFATIRVIRVFTRLRLDRATAWQAAAFPGRVFEKRDRRATDPKADRA
jgi:hypothetical protein